MLDFFANYGADITSLLISVAAIITGSATLVKSFKIAKTTDERIQITRDGIVEAFKTAKIPNEWKISISKQVDTKLAEWRDEFLRLWKENDVMKTEMLALLLKILSFTDASNKLTPEEKAKLEDLTKLITDNDATIDVTE